MGTQSIFCVPVLTACSTCRASETSLCKVKVDFGIAAEEDSKIVCRRRVSTAVSRDWPRSSRGH